ncbi:MAG: riboflavin biosynthesis protein RibF [Myxococcales bacterium]|nr:riboflavin biosynthesis protein RibF [Myxococcales bacterium]MCB9531266.1 riboflavin biosynthesis protein RibF [Myxococcales bacterium]
MEAPDSKDPYSFLDAIVEPHATRLSRGCVLTIGNFDGVHLGHRRLTDAAVADARSRGLPALALTFEPHPATVFKQTPPQDYRLTPEAEKIELLREVGLDGCLVAAFSSAFAALTPDAFVDALLVDRARVRSVHVGFDFNFGRGRSGTTDSLANLLQGRGVSCSVHDAVTDSTGVISSTRVRDALRAGDVGGASALLGRPVRFQGRVAAGFGRGRELGAPTLNVYPATDRLLPRFGVYATRISVGDGPTLAAVSNLGVRPTFADDPRVSLESWVLVDLPPVSIGDELRVDLAGFIRPEQRFASPDALRQQIAADAAQARVFHCLD